MGALAASEAEREREEVINIGGESIVSGNVSSLIIMLRELFNSQNLPTYRLALYSIQILLFV
jgi:hypothetical protein